MSNLNNQIECEPMRKSSVLEDQISSLRDSARVLNEVSGRILTIIRGKQEGCCGDSCPKQTEKTLGESLAELTDVNRDTVSNLQLISDILRDQLGNIKLI